MDNYQIPITPRVFEEFARKKLEQHFSTSLERGRVGSIKKTFDLVSSDNQIIGDAKFYTLVRGMHIPPAKFSVIAEYVWLLEKTNATTKFLIFGNDRRVPETWLTLYGNLINNIDFFFLGHDNHLEKLT